MDDDSVSSLVEKYAVIAGAKPRQSFFTRLLIGLMAANLVHGEAEIGDGLLKGNALAALPEVLTRGRDGAAVFFGQFVVLSVNHHLEQLHHGGNLAWTELVEQLMGMLSVGSR